MDAAGIARAAANGFAGFATGLAVIPGAAALRRTLDAVGIAAALPRAMLRASVVISKSMVEAVRDFYQVTGIILTFSIIPDEVRESLGQLINSFSFDYARFVPASESFTIAVWWSLFGLSLVLVLVMELQRRKLQPDAAKDFLLVRTWGMVSSLGVNATYFVIFVLTALYQPASQNALEILFCGYRWKPILGCDSQSHPHYIIAAVVLLAILTVFLPMRLFLIIRKNVPKLKPFDFEGMSANETLQEYQDELLRDPSPYSFLYSDFERRTLYFAVYTMLMKVYLALVCVLLSGNRVVGYRVGSNKQLTPEARIDACNTAKGWLLIVGLGAFALYSFVKAPFLDVVAERLDRILRIASTATAILAFAGSTKTTAGLILATQIVALVSSVVFLVYSNTFVREWVRQRRGDVVLSTVAASVAADDGQGNDGVAVSGPLSNTSPYVFSPYFDLARARKRVVWQRFWDTLFANHVAFRPPKNQGFHFADTEEMTAYLLHFLGSVGERHRENREIVTDIGRERFIGALQHLEEQSVLDRIFVLRILHGPDVFYGDPDDPTSTFGCCYVVPFSFEAFWISDDGVRKHRVSATEVRSFVQWNCDRRVTAARQTRQQIRAMANMCVDVNGDALKNRMRVNDYAVLDRIEVAGGRKVTVRYTQGYLTVRGLADSPVFIPANTSEHEQKSLSFPVVAGFVVHFHLTRGEYTDPGTGATHETSEQTTLTLDEFCHFSNNTGGGGSNAVGDSSAPSRLSALGIGIAESEALSGLLSHNWNDVQAGMLAVVDAHDRFRLHFMREFHDKQQALSYAFWAIVYDNDRLDADDLKKFLTSYESNPLVVSFFASREGGQQLRLLYQQLAFYDAHPSVAVWVAFWMDVWEHNRHVSVVCALSESEQAEVERRANAPVVPRVVSANVAAATAAIAAPAVPAPAAEAKEAPEVTAATGVNAAAASTPAVPVSSEPSVLVPDGDETIVSAFATDDPAPVLSAASELLSPDLPTSIVWNICSEAEVNARLQRAGLQRPDSGDSSKPPGFIRPALVRELFAAMAAASALPPSRWAAQRPAPVNVATLYELPHYSSFEGTLSLLSEGKEGTRWLTQFMKSMRSNDNLAAAAVEPSPRLSKVLSLSELKLQRPSENAPPPQSAGPQPAGLQPAAQLPTQYSTTAV